MAPKPFPFEPLAAKVGIVLGQIGHADESPNLTGDLAEALGVGGRHVKRMRQHGLSVTQADQFAIRLRLHPATIWPDVYDVGRGEPEPGPPPAPSWLVTS